MATDDYDTGFSSLRYLKLLPVRELKVDESFVSQILENDNDAITVKSIIVAVS
ncbi:MAG: EAL domain-containing protein [Gammaproteobacteria bacterium]|nr:EAL domain-containing protein [Gammaproteobacteria bacterium]